MLAFKRPTRPYFWFFTKMILIKVHVVVEVLGFGAVCICRSMPTFGGNIVPIFRVFAGRHRPANTHGAKTQDLCNMMIIAVKPQISFNKSCSSFKGLSAYKMGSSWLVKVLLPPQKCERPPLWNGWSYGIKNYGFEVTLNGMSPH
jgi:hypothetical protein